MRSLEGRLQALEAQRSTGVVLFSWRMTQGGKAATVIDGVRHVQADGETRREFLDRLASHAHGVPGTFLWLSEEDEKL